MKSKKQDASKGPGAPPGEAESQLSFEESFAVVEGSVEHLERGSLPLEDSLREYERGLSALKACYAILERAQKRIEVLGSSLGSVAEGTSGLYWKPAAEHPALGDEIDASPAGEGSGD